MRIKTCGRIDEEGMTELQATLEFSVELNKFYNVDLFQRGFYQIRTALKTPPKVPSKIEITLQKSQGEDNTLPAHVINDMAVSKTFQILYRNEDVVINDVILYRFHTLVNSTQLEDEMSKLEVQLVLELWFSDEQTGQTSALQRAECVSQRTINIHINPFKGLHHHAPILFDYFHLCCVEVTVHGTLIAIHQPFLSVPKQPKSAWSSRNPDQSSLETVYFGNRPIQPDPDKCLPINLHAAWQMHHRICNILLSAYESLQSTFETCLSDICGSQFKLEHIDCHQKLQKIMDSVRLHDNEEELIQNATVDITQLCACNVILWTQFLETSTLDQGIIFHLAKEHHTNRVKRMAEGFFTHEYQKNECLACYEPSYHGHSDLERVVRNSLYLANLPPMDLECLELDGDCNSLPIIFEDIYHDQASTHDVLTDKRNSRSGSLSPSFSQNNSPQIRTRPKRNFIKNIRPDTFKRPSSFNLKEAEIASTRKTDKECVLVGFRKTTASPNIHSQVIINNLELGTFSPLPSSSSSQVPVTMSNSVSLPSLVRSDWGRNSDGSLPDYVRVARRSLRAKKKSRHPRSIITVEIGGSDPDIKGDDDDDEEGDGMKDRKSDDITTRKLKRAFTDPARRTSSSSSYTDRENTVDKTSDCKKTSDLDSGQSDSMSMNTQSSSEASDSVVKKQLNFDEVLRKNLSESLSKVINDDGLNDSDRSDDDDTCVQNGFDEVLDSYTLTPSTVPQNTTGSSSDNKSVREDNIHDKTVSEDSKRNKTVSEDNTRNKTVLEDSPSKTGRQRHSASANYVQSSAEGSRTNLEDVLSISEISISRDKDVSDTVSQSESSLTVTGSQTTLASKESGITVDIITERDVEIVKDTDKEVTVLELLREEYRKDMNISVSDFSDSGVSGVSMRHNHKSSSDSNLLQSVDADNSDDMLTVKKSTDVMTTSASFPDIYKLSEPKLVDKIGLSTISFISTRESLKSRMKYQGNLYSLIGEQGESSRLASQIPYFHVPDSTDDSGLDGIHLIVCVHGLDGNSADLRLVKTYMEMSLPGYKLEFLMSERNQTDTFAEFDMMTDRLVSEITHHIDLFSLKIARLSFVGHSLGTILVRSALAHTDMIPLLPKLYTFLSLSGPHLGMLYNTSGLVNMGMWFMQKWKKSGSLLQLSLKDQPDARQSFLFKLSQKPGLEFFKHVLLVGSSQDRYVPYHSSRIEMCKAAQRESSGLGSVYAEMVANILTPIVNNPKCKLIRYDVFHALPSTANTIIGRAAHIAVLDSEIFIEKFMMVCGLKYFK